jgi:hypothetical protein
VDKVPKIVSILGAVPIDKVELLPEIADSASDPVFRSILGSLLREIADPFRPPAPRGLRLEPGKPKRLVKPPLIAPSNTMRKLSLSLAEKQRISTVVKLMISGLCFLIFVPNSSDPMNRTQPLDVCAWTGKVNLKDAHLSRCNASSSNILT